MLIVMVVKVQFVVALIVVAAVMTVMVLVVVIVVVVVMVGVDVVEVVVMVMVFVVIVMVIGVSRRSGGHGVGVNGADNHGGGHDLGHGHGGGRRGDSCRSIGSGDSHGSGLVTLLSLLIFTINILSGSLLIVLNCYSVSLNASYVLGGGGPVPTHASKLSPGNQPATHQTQEQHDRAPCPSHQEGVTGQPL